MSAALESGKRVSLTRFTHPDRGTVYNPRILAPGEQAVKKTFFEPSGVLTPHGVHVHNREQALIALDEAVTERHSPEQQQRAKEGLPVYPTEAAMQRNLDRVFSKDGAATIEPTTSGLIAFLGKAHELRFAGADFNPTEFGVPPFLKLLATLPNN